MKYIVLTKLLSIFLGASGFSVAIAQQSPISGPVLTPEPELPIGTCGELHITSHPIDMANEPGWKVKLLGTVASDVEQEKICFKNIPCGLKPFISACPNTAACVNGISSVDGREILTHSAYCPVYAWCISAGEQTPVERTQFEILSWVTGNYTEPCSPTPDENDEEPTNVGDATTIILQ